MPFERSGQYAAGTTFVEGLVFFQSRWYLYYGCADSLVGVAINSPTKQPTKQPATNAGHQSR
jgi:beta-1,2-mannosidase